MKSYEHVKDKRYFNKIIKEGKTLRNKHFVICYLKSENYNYKIGIAVSTKLGHAFYRNKLKRQIRNIVTDNKFLFLQFVNKTISEKDCNWTYQTTLEQSY